MGEKPHFSRDIHSDWYKTELMGGGGLLVVNSIVNCCCMLKETEAEKTIGFFVKFLSLVAFQLGGGPPGYAYERSYTFRLKLTVSCHDTKVKTQ